jgi:hypothetical protein
MWKTVIKSKKMYLHLKKNEKFIENNNTITGNDFYRL